MVCVHPKFAVQKCPQLVPAFDFDTLCWIPESLRTPELFRSPPEAAPPVAVRLGWCDADFPVPISVSGVSRDESVGCGRSIFAQGG